MDRLIAEIEGWKGGEEWALEALMGRYHGLVCGQIKRYIAEDHVVDELANDVWMRVWNKSHLFDLWETADPFAAIIGWLSTVSRNIAIDEIRRRNRKRVVRLVLALDDEDYDTEWTSRIEFKGDSPEDVAIRGQIWERLCTVRPLIPPHMLEAWRLMRMEQKTPAQTVRILGAGGLLASNGRPLNVSTVKVWVFRTSRRLGKYYVERYGSP